MVRRTPGLMKRVVIAVNHLKSREGVSRSAIDLFMNQRYRVNELDSNEGVEMALTEGFIEIKNDRFFLKSSGLPAGPVAVPPAVSVRRKRKRSPGKRGKSRGKRHGLRGRKGAQKNNRSCTSEETQKAVQEDGRRAPRGRRRGRGRKRRASRRRHGRRREMGTITSGVEEDDGKLIGAGRQGLQILPQWTGIGLDEK
ncbi:hypothetical protein J6590_093292 [Homalodisca vitripennis]|nr:hypothetical protein J6590_093292 [Homalodisca vitripennis]